MYMYQMLKNETPELLKTIQEVYKDTGNVHYYLECRINERDIKKQEHDESKMFPVKMLVHDKCPEPTFNQIVFRLLAHEIRVLWILPSKKVLKSIEDKDEECLKFFPENQPWALGWCYMFNGGSLQKMAKNLRKISIESLMLVELSKPFHKREIKAS